MKLPNRLVISFDFELGWGVLESQVWKQREQQGIYKNLRTVFSKLMDLLTATKLPTTWGLVSSSLVEHESELELAHLPASYADAVHKFFREASWETRCTTDLMEKWLTIETFAELCSHSSTHIHADYQGLAADAWVCDIANSCKDLETRFGSKIDSVIFPRDQDRFRLELARVRPMNFRLSPDFLVPTSGIERMLGKLRLKLGDIPASIVVQGACGESYQTGSLFFNWPAGRGEMIRRMRLLQQKSRLVSALANNTGNTYHVWLHPFNLARTPMHFQVFSEFLLEAARLRDAGTIEVLTMRDAGRFCNNDQ